MRSVTQNAGPSSGAPSIGGGAGLQFDATLFHQTRSTAVQAESPLAAATRLQRELEALRANPKEVLVVTGLDGPLAPWRKGPELPNVPLAGLKGLQGIAANGSSVVVGTGRSSFEAVPMLEAEIRPGSKQGDDLRQRRYTILGLHTAMKLAPGASRAELDTAFASALYKVHGFVQDRFFKGKFIKNPFSSLEVLLTQAPVRPPERKIKFGGQDFILEQKPFAVAIHWDAHDATSLRVVTDQLIKLVTDEGLQARLGNGVLEILPGGWPTKASALPGLVEASGAKSLLVIEDDLNGLSVMQAARQLQGGGKLPGKVVLLGVHQPGGPHQELMGASGYPLLASTHTSARLLEWFGRPLSAKK